MLSHFFHLLFLLVPAPYSALQTAEFSFFASLRLFYLFSSSPSSKGWQSRVRDQVRGPPGPEGLCQSL